MTGIHLKFYFYLVLATLGLCEVEIVYLWSWSELSVSRPALMESSWLEGETKTDLSKTSNYWETLAGVTVLGFPTSQSHLVNSKVRYFYQMIILLQIIPVFTTWTESSSSAGSPLAPRANTLLKAGTLGLTSTLTSWRMLATRWFTLLKSAQSCQEGILMIDNHQQFFFESCIIAVDIATLQSSNSCFSE